MEFAQVIAGPLCGTLMADLGADVVHVEPPGAGDSARRMGPAKDGHHLWWKVLGRNKRSVTLDMHAESAGELVQRLVEWADVVVVTFRARTVERFGLDWESVHRINPGAVLLQISGYGENTSLRDSPGFGKMGEARSGLVHLTGFPDGPPVHTGFSHGDAVTGLMGAFAVCAALVRRANHPEHRGEWIDLALFEPLFRLVEWQVILHDQLGTVPGRSGNALAVAPAAVIGCYRTSDNAWVTVTSGTPRSVTNVVRLLGMDAAALSDPTTQVAARAEIDTALAKWIAARPADEAVAALVAAEVVASRVLDVADIVADPTYAERGDIVTVTDADLGEVRMQAALPHFRTDPGSVWRTGAALGADNDLVYRDWLGLAADELATLRSSGAI
ncbi:CoA-transferase [Frankia canadensis]|uniref:CoA-transferase n=1 Tax=Frankia canadensis TaxID=1836972 RepID=A0A2I2KLT6_9ACTN|nr:CoA-transferase [Frankia canadensis]SOU53912.1 CoA-transferase [Frankia canadensis]